MFKLCLSFLLAFMIALQSFVAVADIHPVTLDQDTHLSEHTPFETEPVHHDNNGGKNPDCHHGHCHHASVVFVVKDHQTAVTALLNDKISRLTQTGSTFLLSPDLRPPII